MKDKTSIEDYFYMKSRSEEILSNESNGVMLTRLAVEFNKFFHTIGEDRLKKEFLGKMYYSSSKRMNQLSTMKIKEYLGVIPKCIVICELVLENSKSMFNKTSLLTYPFKFKVKIDKDESSILDRGRPIRGGFGILDTYITQAYKSGILEDINEAYNMYLVSKFMNYDDEGVINTYISYLRGYTSINFLIKNI